MKLKPFFLLAAVAIVGAGGYAAGAAGFGRERGLELMRLVAVAAPSETKPTGNVIYYRHPDDLPEYSSVPKRTADGRPFGEVRESEDVSLDPMSRGPKEATGERAVLFYRNPMGLPDTSPVPKKDSMGMDYIPVYEGEEPDAGSVRVPLGKLQRSGIKTATAKRQVVQTTVRVPGTIQFDERRIRVVAMRTDAFIDEVADVTTGDLVSPGDTLFSFYSTEIARAAAEFAATARAGGQTDTNSGLGLQLRNLGVPEETIKRIAADKAVPRSIPYYASQTGVILERNATMGMMAAAGEVLFKIADNSVVWVVADVPEYDLAQVRVGDVVTVKLQNRPGEALTGAVDLIYPEIQSQTRTAKVRVELPNPEGHLAANMFADVQIATGVRQPVVAVPTSAVVDTGDRQIVFVEKGDGRFEPRDVTTGARGNEMSEIKAGIDPGERVVVSGNFLLDAESNLTSAISAMAAQEVKP